MSLFRLAFGAEDDVIQGQRVYLRPLRMTDFQEWKTLRQNSRSFLEPWEPSWQPDEFTRSHFAQRVRFCRERASADASYSYVLFDATTRQMMGGLTLGHVRRGVSQSASLGYWMGAAFAGRGFMKDALLAVIAACPSRFGLHRLEAACIPRNETSRKLLLACGFEAEGFAKSYVKIAGIWEDHLLFGKVLDRPVPAIAKQGKRG